MGAHLLVPVIPAGATGSDINDVSGVFDHEDARRQLLAAAEMPIAENDDADPLSAGLGAAPKPKLDCDAHFPAADMTAPEADGLLRSAIRSDWRATQHA